jgi:voltage-gated potassium channel Kch
MSTIPTIICTVGGVLLIAIALRDVFDVLFHESGRAVLASLLMRLVWRGVRGIARRRRSALSLAGPFSLLAVVTTWGLLLVVGWTLVFWPRMPDAFHLSSGVDPGSPFVDSLYTSLVTLSTVGFGDISPATPVLRVLTPLEALLGLGLLTASISWLLAIYPVLLRRRSLAYEINLLVDSQKQIGAAVLELDSGSAESILSELTSRLVAVERDMATFPVAYYFSTADSRFSLPEALPALFDLAERGSEESVPAALRLRATMLHDAIDDFANALRGFHGGAEGSTRELVEAYRRDHLG